jgi:hypothetical protein
MKAERNAFIKSVLRKLATTTWMTIHYALFPILVELLF